MSLTGIAYTAALADLAAGTFTAATQIDVLLASSGYTFGAAHAVSDVEPYEVADASYARFVAGSVFTVGVVSGEVHFSALDPAPSWPALSTTDWRYAVLLQHTSGAPYLCLDSGVTNSRDGGTLSINPGADPYLRLVIGS